MSPTSSAGLPITIFPGGIERRTTVPAPMTQSRPIRTPLRMCASVPTHTFSSITGADEALCVPIVCTDSMKIAVDDGARAENRSVAYANGLVSYDGHSVQVDTGTKLNLCLWRRSVDPIGDAGPIEDATVPDNHGSRPYDLEGSADDALAPLNAGVL